MSRIDFDNMTKEEFDQMSRKAVYMPKIGRFVFSWKAIQWNRKIDKIKKEEYDD